MATSTASNEVLFAEGLVEKVDSIARELTVRIGSRLQGFNVPPDCVIVVNDERVKMRLLQPRDHVKVAYRVDPDHMRADHIQVTWLSLACEAVGSPAIIQSGSLTSPSFVASP